MTSKEFDVLALLDSKRGAVLSREQLMNEVWDENWFGSTKTLDATIGRLRQKLDDDRRAGADHHRPGRRLPPRGRPPDA